MKNSTNQRIFTKEQTAEMLGVSTVTVERWAAKGLLPAIKLPSSGHVGRPRSMWDIEDINAFIEGCRDNAPDCGDSVRPRPLRRRRAPRQASALDALKSSGVLQ